MNLSSLPALLLVETERGGDKRMIHHVSVGTNDVARSRAFYDPIMQVLGLRLVRSTGESADYGTALVIFSLETPVNGAPAAAGNGVHIAFDAGGRRTVDEFHAVGLRHGGKDAGAPGLRPKYDPHYYAAFLLDPDGNKIEAVTHHGA
jgi:catechol 2,3-dioxygenase-like lactoylglutathione lyase family enzyme